MRYGGKYMRYIMDTTTGDVTEQDAYAAGDGDATEQDDVSDKSAVEDACERLQARSDRLYRKYLEANLTLDIMKQYLEEN